MILGVFKCLLLVLISFSYYQAFSISFSYLVLVIFKY